MKVARDEDITEQIGKDIYFDLVDHEKVKSFRIEKQTPFLLFKVDYLPNLQQGIGFVKKIILVK